MHRALGYRHQKTYANRRVNIRLITLPMITLGRAGCSVMAALSRYQVVVARGILGRDGDGVCPQIDTLVAVDRFSNSVSWLVNQRMSMTILHLTT